MRTSAEIQRQRKKWSILLWTIVAIALICMVGFVVCIFLIGWEKGDIVTVSIVSGGCFLGAAGLGLVGMRLFRFTDRLAAEELDALECEDDENSFFVGDGTLATFGEDKLRIHGRVEGKKDVVVPYYDLKFFSVCARREPKERGAWSVVIEIPARYFNHSASRTMPAVLIQTDGKERLYARMKELGLELVGEPYTEQQSTEKFVPLDKFKLADRVKRNKALILFAIGILCAVGGILAGFFWELTPGCVLLVLGLYLIIRASLAFVRAWATFGIYNEGIHYNDPSGLNNVFLKWEEFSAVDIFEQDNQRYLRAHCPYGVYDLPYFEGAYEKIVERHPEKAAK